MPPHRYQRKPLYDNYSPSILTWAELSPYNVSRITGVKVLDRYSYPAKINPHDVCGE